MCLEKTEEITALLREWGGGRSLDGDQLFELLYPELRQIAGALMQREAPMHVLQPTGVVNELFLKLVRQHKLDFENRQHFYSFAARLMRRILVDYARAQKSQKRDAGGILPLRDDAAWFELNPTTAIDLDRVLKELEQLDARKCRMVELRFMLGFTIEETADLIGVSTSSVDRDLRFARTWLRNRLEQIG